MSFLLDTDICSAHLKNHPLVISKVMLHLGSLAISVITLAELTTWVRRSKSSPQRTISLRNFLNDVNVLPIDVVLAEKFGEVRATLLDQGLPMPIHDLWIAATALQNNLTLVTHNTRDFASVPQLALQDWTQP